MHNIKEFIDMNENDFDSFFNILYFILKLFKIL